MRVLNRLILWYFALVGVVAHLGLVALWFAKPDLVWSVRERASEWLSEHVAFLAPADLTPKNLHDDQVFGAIPAWQPEPEGPDAPLPGFARIGTRHFSSPELAARALAPGDVLDIGAGLYKAPLIIAASNVTVQGHGHVVFEGAAAQGKGTFLVTGNDVVIRNLECRQVKVASGNGACIRLEGSHLTVEQVYFHDSEEGILTGQDPGLVEIRASRFERLGHRGQAHGIYIGGGRLVISDSLFLAARREGHEIKTRALDNTIERSVIASLNGVDSRLIDAPDGGVLRVIDSILLEGPDTANSDLIGFALERKGGAPPGDRVVLRNNLILIDNQRAARLLHLADDAIAADVRDNVIVSGRATAYDKGNVPIRGRTEAGLPPYPALPLDRLPARAPDAGP